MDHVEKKMRHIQELNKTLIGYMHITCVDKVAAILVICLSLTFNFKYAPIPILICGIQDFYLCGIIYRIQKGISRLLMPNLKIEKSFQVYISFSSILFYLTLLVLSTKGTLWALL